MLYNNLLTERIKKSTIGYPYLIYSYIAYCKLKNKSVIITEWGADKSLDYVKPQLNILAKFKHELDGLFFYYYSYVDYDNDGKIDNQKLYNYFKYVNIRG